MKKFLFVDDHPVVRAGFIKVLAEPFSPVQIEEAGNGEEAMKEIRNNLFELVVLDVQMPDTDAMSLVRLIKKHSVNTKILMLSIGPENIYAAHYLKAGADGYLCKQSSATRVIRTISSILANESKDAVTGDTFGSAAGLNAQTPFDKLSKREFEIASLLLQGNSITDISKMLNVSTSTTGTLKSRLFEKLKISNLLELKDLAATYSR